MIHGSSPLPAECQPIIKPPPKCPPDCPIDPPPPPTTTTIEKIIQLAKDNPDITGGIVSIGVTGTLAVVATVPLAVAAVVGAAVWFAIRTVL
jgi:hypothetical protein